LKDAKSLSASLADVFGYQSSTGFKPFMPIQYFFQDKEFKNGFNITYMAALDKNNILVVTKIITSISGV
jgi:hypothetical protein